jgi:4-hydroxy-2-oxoglutarate aldolase
MDYSSKLNGVFPPCATIFEAGTEDVDYSRIRENLEKYNATDIRGFMPLGTNGEFRSLTDEESVKVIRVYAKYRDPSKTILAGAGRESARATIEIIKLYADLGVDFASLLPPHYFTSAMTDDALVRYYSAVADASPVPVLLYNIPKYAGGVVISTDLIRRLAEHPNIAGMKDTSGEPIVPYIEAVPEGANFCILAGTINKFYEGLQHGAVGGVLSIADYLPGKCCELQRLHEEGKADEAATFDIWIRKLSANAAGKYGVPGVKAAMDIVGYAGGAPRLPLSPLTEEQKDKLRLALEAEGMV